MKRNLFFCFLITLSLKNFCQSCVSCNSTQSINSNLIACYPFNGNTNDETGNGNNGTNNGATLTSDRFGNVNSAYLFNGTSNYRSWILGLWIILYKYIQGYDWLFK